MADVELQPAPQGPTFSSPDSTIIPTAFQPPPPSIFSPPNFIQSYTKHRSWIHRKLQTYVFSSPKWIDFNTAVRGAIFLFALIVFTLLHMYPDGQTFPGYYLGAIMFILAFQNNIGRTLACCWYQGVALFVAGSIIAFARHFFPFHHTSTAIIMLLTLVLTLWSFGHTVHPAQYKIFAGFAPMYIMMVFMRKQDELYSLKLVGVSYFGFLAAILAIYLPYPITASTKLQEITYQTIKNTTKLFYLLNKAFLSDSQHHKHRDVLLIQSIHTQTHAAHQHLANSKIIHTPGPTNHHPSQQEQKSRDIATIVDQLRAQRHLSTRNTSLRTENSHKSGEIVGNITPTPFLTSPQPSSHHSRPNNNNSNTIAIVKLNKSSRGHLHHQSRRNILSPQHSFFLKSHLPNNPHDPLSQIVTPPPNAHDVTLFTPHSISPNSQSPLFGQYSQTIGENDKYHKSLRRAAKGQLELKKMFRESESDDDEIYCVTSPIPPRSVSKISQAKKGEQTNTKQGEKSPYMNNTPNNNVIFDNTTRTIGDLPENNTNPSYSTESKESSSDSDANDEIYIEIDAIANESEHISENIHDELISIACSSSSSSEVEESDLESDIDYHEHFQKSRLLQHNEDTDDNSEPEIDVYNDTDEAAVLSHAPNIINDPNIDKIPLSAKSRAKLQKPLSSNQLSSLINPTPSQKSQSDSFDSHNAHTKGHPNIDPNREESIYDTYYYTPDMIKNSAITGGDPQLLESTKKQTTNYSYYLPQIYLTEADALIETIYEDLITARSLVPDLIVEQQLHRFFHFFFYIVPYSIFCCCGVLSPTHQADKLREKHQKEGYFNTFTEYKPDPLCPSIGSHKEGSWFLTPYSPASVTNWADETSTLLSNARGMVSTLSSMSNLTYGGQIYKYLYTHYLGNDMLEVCIRLKQYAFLSISRNQDIVPVDGAFIDSIEGLRRSADQQLAREKREGFAPPQPDIVNKINGATVHSSIAHVDVFTALWNILNKYKISSNNGVVLIGHSSEKSNQKDEKSENANMQFVPENPQITQQPQLKLNLSTPKPNKLDRKYAKHNQEKILERNVRNMEFPISLPFVHLQLRNLWVLYSKLRKLMLYGHTHYHRSTPSCSNKSDENHKSRSNCGKKSRKRTAIHFPPVFLYHNHAFVDIDRDNTLAKEEHNYHSSRFQNIAGGTIPECTVFSYQQQHLNKQNETVKVENVRNKNKHKKMLQHQLQIQDIITTSNYFFNYDRFVNRFVRMLASSVNPHLYKIINIHTTIPPMMALTNDGVVKRHQLNVCWPGDSDIPIMTPQQQSETMSQQSNVGTTIFHSTSPPPLNNLSSIPHVMSPLHELPDTHSENTMIAPPLLQHTSTSSNSHPNILQSTSLSLISAVNTTQNSYPTQQSFSSGFMALPHPAHFVQNHPYPSPFQAKQHNLESLERPLPSPATLPPTYPQSPPSRPCMKYAHDDDFLIDNARTIQTRPIQRSESHVINAGNIPNVGTAKRNKNIHIYPRIGLYSLDHTKPPHFIAPPFFTWDRFKFIFIPRLILIWCAFLSDLTFHPFSPKHPSLWALLYHHIAPTPADLAHYRRIIKTTLCVFLPALLVLVPSRYDQQAFIHWGCLTAGLLISDPSAAIAVVSRIAGTLVASMAGFVINMLARMIDQNFNIKAMMFLAICLAAWYFLMKVYNTQKNANLNFSTASMLTSCVIAMGALTPGAGNTWVLQRIQMTLFGCLSVLFTTYLLWPTTSFHQFLIQSRQILKQSQTTNKINFALLKLVTLATSPQLPPTRAGETYSVTPLSSHHTLISPDLCASNQAIGHAPQLAQLAQPDEEFNPNDIVALTGPSLFPALLLEEQSSSSSSSVVLHNNHIESHNVSSSLQQLIPTNTSHQSIPITMSSHDGIDPGQRNNHGDTSTMVSSEKKTLITEEPKEKDRQFKQFNPFDASSTLRMTFYQLFPQHKPPENPLTSSEFAKLYNNSVQQHTATIRSAILKLSTTSMETHYEISLLGGDTSPLSHFLEIISSHSDLNRVLFRMHECLYFHFWLFSHLPISTIKRKDGKTEQLETSRQPKNNIPTPASTSQYRHGDFSTHLTQPGSSIGNHSRAYSQQFNIKPDNTTATSTAHLSTIYNISVFTHYGEYITILIGDLLHHLDANIDDATVHTTCGLPLTLNWHNIQVRYTTNLKARGRKTAMPHHKKEKYLRLPPQTADNSGILSHINLARGLMFSVWNKYFGPWFISYDANRADAATYGEMGTAKDSIDPDEHKSVLHDDEQIDTGRQDVDEDDIEQQHKNQQRMNQPQFKPIPIPLQSDNIRTTLQQTKDLLHIYTNTNYFDFCRIQHKQQLTLLFTTLSEIVAFYEFTLEKRLSMSYRFNSYTNDHKNKQQQFPLLFLMNENSLIYCLCCIPPILLNLSVAIAMLHKSSQH